MSKPSDDDHHAKPAAEPTPLGDNLGVYIPSDSAPEANPAIDLRIDFGTFLIGFFQSGMMHLGRLEHPELGESLRDLQAARHNVEILELLEHKTRGNLEPEEEKLLSQLLYDLRVAYVEERDKQEE